jgi:signal transduction histidine kinase
MPRPNRTRALLQPAADALHESFPTLPQLRLRKISWLWLGFITACVGLMAVGSALNVNLYRMHLPFALGMAILHAAALAVTVVRPPLGMLVSLVPLAVAPLVSNPAGAAPMPFSVVAMVTQVLVICTGAMLRGWALPALVWLASIGIGVAVNYQRMPLSVTAGAAADVVVFASVSGGLLVAAAIARQWQGIRDQLLAERTLSAEEQSRRRLAEERSRIGRELHDVVAHGMSIVVVQATTAPYRHPDLTPELRSEFEDIAANSRRAMTEMRSMLGALRSGADARELAPQPGLADLPQLLANARTAGISVQDRIIDPLDEAAIGEVIGLTAYRIVQEALSNVIRHAPGAEVQVLVRQQGNELHVQVTNGPSDVGAVLAQLERGNTGHGIIGMRERASIVGGTLHYGPTPEGGFTVAAVLPLLQVQGGSGQ